MNVHLLAKADDPIDFRSRWKSNNILRETLCKYIETLVDRTVPASDYQDAAWAFKQADRNGYNRALTEVLNILKSGD